MYNEIYDVSTYENLFVFIDFPPLPPYEHIPWDYYSALEMLASKKRYQVNLDDMLKFIYAHKADGIPEWYMKVRMMRRPTLFQCEIMMPFLFLHPQYDPMRLGYVTFATMEQIFQFGYQRDLYPEIIFNAIDSMLLRAAVEHPLMYDSM